MDELLAEYLGIHYGDGHLSKPLNYTYRIHITTNIREKEYALFVQRIFLVLFNKNMTYKEIKEKHSI